MANEWSLAVPALAAGGFAFLTALVVYGVNFVRATNAVVDAMRVAEYSEGVNFRAEVLLARIAATTLRQVAREAAKDTLSAEWHGFERQWQLIADAVGVAVLQAVEAECLRHFKDNEVNADHLGLAVATQRRKAISRLRGWITDRLAEFTPAPVTPEPPLTTVDHCCPALGPGNYHCTQFRGHGGHHIAAGMTGNVFMTWPLLASEARPTTEDDDEPTHANKPKAQQERSQSESACCTKTSATSAGQGQAESPKASVVVTDLSPSPPPAPPGSVLVSREDAEKALVEARLAGLSSTSGASRYMAEARRRLGLPVEGQP